MRQLQHVAVLRRLLQDIALAADVADQRHHHLFPDGIDGRIRHLREELLEVVEKRLRLVGETGQRRVRAHRPDGLFSLRRHRGQNHPQIFIAISKGALAAKKSLGVRIMHARGLGQLIDGDLILFHPLAYGCRDASFCLISLSETMRPSTVSTRNIFPGCRRPLLFTCSGAISSTPASEAMTTRSSWVTT